MALNDVTFRLANSDDCYGVNSGNDNVGGPSNAGWSVNTIAGGLFGGGWDAYVKDNGAAGSLNGYLGLNWTLDAPQGLTAGNWTLALSDPPPSSLPVTVDMAVVLKGGDSWAVYFFDDETFSLAGSNGGTFDIQFLNVGGRTPGLSHMTLYLRQGTPPEICIPGNPNCNRIPEPASLALLGWGLAGAVLMFRRRRN